MISLEDNSGDVVVVSKFGKEYKFYSIILRLHSSYFEQYFEAQQTNKSRVETQLRNIILENLLNYLLAYSKGLTEEANDFIYNESEEINWLEWVDLAEFYDISHLKSYCQQRLVIEIPSLTEPDQLNTLFKYDLPLYKHRVIVWLLATGFETYDWGKLAPHVIREFSQERDSYHRILYIWTTQAPSEVVRVHIDELLTLDFKKNRHAENDHYLYKLLPFLSRSTRVIALEALAQNYISLLPRLTQSLPHSELFLDD